MNSMSDAIVAAERDTHLLRNSGIIETGVLGLFLKDAKRMSVGGKMFFVLRLTVTYEIVIRIYIYIIHTYNMMI